MRYRPDIDGLRALAVLPVVAFHYGLERVAPGGFVGVDVFFVISGFLITRMICDDIAAGSYSVARFYERRVRRIFPALFAMFAVCLAASVWLYFPSEIEDVGASIVSSVFFVSNLYFAGLGSYFDASLRENPVLHTWSLSVEEQFYVLFPLLVLAVRYCNPKWLKPVLAGAAALSFAASAVQAVHHPTDAFYMTYSRAWELLLGGLVALELFPAVAHRALAEIAAAAGIAAILFAIVFYDAGTPFPGVSALAPAGGAALILYAGMQRPTAVYRFLALPPLRFVGLISYSLYLWHWPIFVFYTSYFYPDRPAKVMLLLASMTVAAASWRFVERPFRARPAVANPAVTGGRGTLGAAVGAMAATACLAVILGPIEAHYRPVSQTAAASIEYEHYKPERFMRVGTCFLTSEYNSVAWFQPDNCLRLDPAKRNVLIVGDSHAAHLWPGFQAAYPNINFLQANASGCKPVDHASGPARCTDLMAYVFDTFLPAHHVDLIVLSARWVGGDVAAAVATATRLRPYAERVVISGPIEEYNQAPPRLLARAEAAGENAALVAAAHLRPEPPETDRLFAAASLSEGVQYVSVYRTLCTPQCPLAAHGGVPLQFDYYGHLTREGAIYLAERIGPQFLGPAPNTLSARDPN